MKIKNYRPNYIVEEPESVELPILPYKVPKEPLPSVSQIIGAVAEPIVRGAVRHYGPHLETAIPAAVNSSKKALGKLFKRNTTKAPEKVVVYKASKEPVAAKLLTNKIFLEKEGGGFAHYNPTDKFKYIETVTTAPPPTYTMTRVGKNALSSRSVVSAPVARSVRVKNSNKPRMSSSPSGVIVRHKELIGGVFSSSTTLSFLARRYIINPGKSDTFPWLSQLASNFDKYRLLSLKVSLVSNQPTTTAGRIGVGIDYDSTDPLPSDRLEFFALSHHAECAPWDSVDFTFPFKPEEKFVNSHTSTDSKLIDCGQLIVMSDQIVATDANMADIIVEYAVELFEPQQGIYQSMFWYGLNSLPSAFTFIGPVIGKFTSSASTTVCTLDLPIGRYFIATEQYDVAPSHITCTLTIHGGTGYGGPFSAGTTSDVTVALVNVTSADGQVTFTYSASTGGCERLNVVVSKVAGPIGSIWSSVTHSSALTTY